MCNLSWIPPPLVSEEVGNDKGEDRQLTGAVVVSVAMLAASSSDRFTSCQMLCSFSRPSDTFDLTPSMWTREYSSWWKTFSCTERNTTNVHTIKCRTAKSCGIYLMIQYLKAEHTVVHSNEFFYYSINRIDLKNKLKSLLPAVDYHRHQFIILFTCDHVLPNKH